VLTFRGLIKILKNRIVKRSSVIFQNFKEFLISQFAQHFISTVRYIQSQYYLYIYSAYNSTNIYYANLLIFSEKLWKKKLKIKIK